MMDGKAALRDAVLCRRAGLSADERRAAGEAIAGALRPLLDHAVQVAAYAAVGTEPPIAVGADALLPVLLDDGDLDWATGPLRPAGRGLREPAGPRLGVDAIAACDLVLVPALAVDRRGTRLGRGGGSYDRALRRAVGLTIAVLYDDELVDAVPAEPHDVAVAAVVTPSYGVVRF
jgi:5-formyltetrahydrofolate cyclo-ligase